jgi:hypothetical protein
MDKSILEIEGSIDSKVLNQLVSDTHIGEEYRSSCDGWVRPSSQAKCKTLLTLLQEHVLPKTIATTSPSDDTKTKL